MKKYRIITGAVVLVSGFLSPLLIPAVLNSHLSATFKSVLSGLLAFGIPEIFMLVAVAIMGKSGYLYLKDKAVKIITIISPQKVSKTRHFIGVVFFVAPIILGFFQPYLAHYFTFFNNMSLSSIIGADLMLLLSLFILGGDFWEKLKGLFNYNIISIKRPINEDIPLNN